VGAPNLPAEQRIADVLRRHAVAPEVAQAMERGK
jgi:hypothetical protein